MNEQEPVRTVPDIDVETEPTRRLEPEKICPDQQRSVTEIVIKEIP